MILRIKARLRLPNFLLVELRGALTFTASLCKRTYVFIRLSFKDPKHWCFSIIWCIRLDACKNGRTRVKTLKPKYEFLISAHMKTQACIHTYKRYRETLWRSVRGRRALNSVYWDKYLIYMHDYANTKTFLKYKNRNLSTFNVNILQVLRTSCSFIRVFIIFLVQP
jgi:hypothetical protein